MDKNRIASRSSIAPKPTPKPKPDVKIAIERGNIDVVQIQLLNSINLNLTEVVRELKIANKGL